DHCVSLRVFASSRETKAVVCPRFGRMPVERYVPIERYIPVERYAPTEWCGMPRLKCGVSPLPVAEVVCPPLRPRR
ncbi:MAG: hypothetical protein ACK6EB_33045, partial [Planctomyces sp.]